MPKPKKSDILSFLNSEFIMQIATATLKGKPQVNVMLFAVDKDLHFYFATHKSSRKAKNLKQNNQVSITVWKHKKMMVQVDARVKPLTKEADINHALDLLADKATMDEEFWPPLLQIEGNDYIIYKAKPSKMTMLDLSQPTIHKATSPFTVIK